MPTTENPLGLSHANQTLTPTSATNSVLSYLAFEGHAIRFGLQLSTCVILYTFLAIMPWQLVGVEGDWRMLASWAVACSVIALTDQFILRRAVYGTRDAYQLALAGAYERALHTLERVGPNSSCFVPCPRPLYHMLRADIFTQAEAFASAERELQLAEQVGARADVRHVSKSRIFRGQGDYETALVELDDAVLHCGETPTILLEQGVLLLEQRQDMWRAKRLFQRVAGMDEATHFSGDSSTQLAQSYLEVSRLWTGEAEEGLEGLSRAIDRLRGIVLYVDTLRPVLAYLCAERSYYLATHREPQAACADLKLATALCTHPSLRKRAEQVIEELRWRHGISLNSLPIG